ncbi:MAG: hypothetical protein AB7P76_04505 [Candidatus Melainabacteria bacterium]
MAMSSVTPGASQPAAGVYINISNPTAYGNGQSAVGANPYQQTAGGYSGGITPGGTPQQTLQSAYQDAMNARNAAEQARAAYLNLANQLNTQAYQQPAQQPSYPQPAAMPGAQPGALPGAYPVPVNQFNVPPGGFPQQVPPQTFAPQPIPGQLPGQQPGQPMMPTPESQVPPPPPAGQPGLPPEQAAQGMTPGAQPAPGALKTATVEQLNAMIANPQNLQQKVDAMEELGIRGAGSPETYELLKKEAMTDTTQLAGQLKDDAVYVRQAALWTLGMLNKAQNAQVPAEQLPGLKTIEQIIDDRNADPDVAAAAVQALQVINRPEKPITAILKKASKSKNPDVSRLAKEALSGKGITIPSGAPGTPGPAAPMPASPLNGAPAPAMPGQPASAPALA